jgi:CheY-like chemotaxis protein
MIVMVVDDEEDARLLFKQRFRKELKEGKMEFIFCASGQEALDELTSDEAPHILVILSDINMPGMSGIELLKILKKKYPAIHVIMITAYGDELTYKLAMENGADGFVNKPIDFEELKKEMVQLYANG